MIMDIRVKLWTFFFCLALALFLMFPQVDIWVSSLFFKPDTQFYMHGYPWVVFIDNSAEIFAWGLVLFCLFFLGINTRFWGLTKKDLIFILLVFALAPGLVVNVIFKNHWGRARPSKIEQFGGHKKFTPAFVLSKECERNCAFVSGHASIGFALVALGFVKRKHGAKITAAAMASGAIIGLARLARGAHYLSDIVFAFFIVYAAAYIINCLMFGLRGQNEKPTA
jgi:lipid A 4'-phosphatase